MSSIDTRSLHELPTATVIDVREVHEYVAGHAPTAINVPLSQLVERVAEIPRGQDVYIICESGGRSAQATQWLNDQGVRAINVLGGTSAWRSAALPVATGGN
jgi:rhodanese-related sulfurtransferase